MQEVVGYGGEQGGNFAHAIQEHEEALKWHRVSRLQTRRDAPGTLAGPQKVVDVVQQVAAAAPALPPHRSAPRCHAVRQRHAFRQRKLRVVVHDVLGQVPPLPFREGVQWGQLGAQHVVPVIVLLAVANGTHQHLHSAILLHLALQHHALHPRPVHVHDIQHVALLQGVSPGILRAWCGGRRLLCLPGCGKHGALAFGRHVRVCCTLPRGFLHAGGQDAQLGAVGAALHDGGRLPLAIHAEVNLVPRI